MRVFLALTLLATLEARAQSYEYLGFKNLSSQSNPFRYYVDARQPDPAGLALSGVMTTTQEAWNAWNAVSCAVPKASYAGLSSAVPIPNAADRFDVYNVTPVWVTSANDPAYSEIFTPGITAMALPLAYAGELKNCDIYLNGVEFNWALAMPGSNQLDVKTVMLHEAGHCLGLDHFFIGTGNVMQGSVTTGVTRRVLTAADADALCSRYPTANAVGAPCDPMQAGSCGAGLRCVSQTLPEGGSTSFCSKGCPLGQNYQCDLPLACLASNQFSDQGFNGACLRSTNNVTQVGKPCTGASQCGSAVAICEVESQATSGAPQWVGGYCSQACGSGKAPCPPQSSCVTFAAGEFCLMTCRVGYADCRPGYACALTSTGGGVCVPRCSADVDCGNTTEYQCRPCDGLCLAKQNPTAQIGDMCSSNAHCGLGQVCAALGLSTSRQCTQGCGSGCAQCPTGSSCHAAGPRGEWACLRDCNGPGSCPFGLSCGFFSTGRGCVPPCISDVQCPVGTVCNSGECSEPTAGGDAGCPLCPPDAGKPIGGGPSDAGGPGTSGGCGCQTGFGLETFATMGAVLLWARARERRQCRRR